MKFPKSQRQSIEMNYISDSVWLLAEPNIQFIIDKLHNYNNDTYYDNQPFGMSFYFQYSLFRDVSKYFYLI